MMQITLSYPNVPPVDIPDANLLATLEPREIGSPRPVENLAEEALDHPIGAEALEKFVGPSSKVLVLVDDITRQTPAHALLPSVFRRLSQAGVTRQNITILIAAGTHSHMTKSELEVKLGAKTLEEFAVHLHYWKDESHLRHIGAASDGTPIRVNRMLGEVDFVIGIGQIVPHRVMGFTGGSTIVQPGVSGPEITGHTHWLSTQYPGSEIMGIVDNPVRREVQEIARLAGLRYIVNVVMDRKERVIHVVAGHPVEAHRRGSQHSLEIFGASLPELADIVVAESYPADYDLWQASKGLYSSELAVKPGGVVILITPCPHGVSIEHPEVEKLGYHTVEEVKQMVASRKITDLIGAAHLAHVGRVICDRARGIMVSSGIAPDTQKSIGFRPARTLADGLEMAFSMAGRDAKVAVLRQGGHVLPRVAAKRTTTSSAP